MDTKFCIQCKHYTLENTSAHVPHLGRCMKSAEICLVTGKQKQYDDLSFCSTMRIKPVCGPDAKLFEAK
jgi:hypothetical protein